MTAPTVSVGFASHFGDFWISAFRNVASVVPYNKCLLCFAGNGIYRRRFGSSRRRPLQSLRECRYAARAAGDRPYGKCVICFAENGIYRRRFGSSRRRPLQSLRECRYAARSADDRPYGKRSFASLLAAFIFGVSGRRGRRPLQIGWTRDASVRSVDRNKSRL